MNANVQDILAQIDRLDEAGREELQAALRLRSRAQWERLAEVERARSMAEGITEEDIDRAIDDVRYGKKAS
jgi:F0F1-type ATP synthase membrane subunit b/b'